MKAKDTMKDTDIVGAANTALKIKFISNIVAITCTNMTGRRFINNKPIKYIVMSTVDIIANNGNSENKITPADFED